MKREDMEIGKKYLVQTKIGPFGAINTGYVGIYKGAEGDNIVLDDAVKLDLPALAMGIEESTPAGRLSLPAKIVFYISEPSTQ